MRVARDYRFPAAKGIQDVVGGEKRKARHVRDAWYRLVAGTTPFHPDGPGDEEPDIVAVADDG